MEMPDVIYADDKSWYTKSPHMHNHSHTLIEYHHSRIVEALKAEKEELKAAVTMLEQKLRDVNKAHDRAEAKLDKAKWQPIETAPKDGKSILVTDGYDVCDAYFRGGDWWQYQCGDDWYSTSINPTHWMPLPSCPE